MVYQVEEARSVDVGQKIREIRKEHGLTIKALAAASGIAANTLSMIEQSRSQATISTLYKLADALGVSVTTLFREEHPGDEIVFRKASERTRVPFQRGIWEGLGGEAFIDRVEPFMLTLEAGANSGPADMVHSGHEFVICLRGQLHYQVDGRLFKLDPGDSLLFAAHLPHRWRNPGSTVMNAVFVLSGFAGSHPHPLDPLQDPTEQDDPVG
jgi:transcriptional regulator with XRE-family HTH domain